jgi:hypothetical protein
MSRRAALLGSVVATLAAGGLAFAGGSVPTDLRLSNSAPAFHGKVRSVVPSCEPDRRVKLFRQRPRGSVLLGRTDSGPNGRWLIEVDPLKSGAYYAKVKQHVVSVDKRGTLGTVTCAPDFSRTLTVD